MLKSIPAFILVLFLITISQAQTEDNSYLTQKYTANLQQLFELKEKISQVHPILHKLYPVAVVEDSRFYIFDLSEEGDSYEFIKDAASDMPVPQKLRAAFPLSFYDNKMACVVTEDVFADISGYVTIFHEFIHCAQMETCEMKIKSRLGVAQKAQEENNYVWELEFPFPYEDSLVLEIYTLFMESAEAKDLNTVNRCRTNLKDIINTHDYEYMTWQEWKEGFARFLENKIRRELELEENHGGVPPPFNRVSFYEGGARFISLLLAEEEELAEDIEALFYRMLGK